MDCLWVGSDVDLSTLHQCRQAERLEYRLSCLHKHKNLKSKHCQVDFEEETQSNSNDEHDHLRRRRRSGTWPRTRSLNAPSPIQQFGPCGRIMKNSAMVM
ncbi:hypothetical protein WA026_010817 [Henosepilachna vigintioctopunctata]|uniref:Uncharacterized protein n=1 Tax=Henosepilachna vigintioctopunctata TaxID=420089 RepID=A0AAW1UR76_9CUCU